MEVFDLTIFQKKPGGKHDNCKTSHSDFYFFTRTYLLQVVLCVHIMHITLKIILVL